MRPHAAGVSAASEAGYLGQHLSLQRSLQASKSRQQMLDAPPGPGTVELGRTAPCASPKPLDSGCREARDPPKALVFRGEALILRNGLQDVG